MPTIPVGQTIPNSFNFTLSVDCTSTSAGVYSLSGVLIRTLWSNVPYKAGTHTAYWDGKNDLGVQQAYTNYNIQVVSNNIAYTWEGTIGNNSTNSTGPTKWAAYGATISDMVNVGSYMYCGMWFSEYTAGQMKFNTATPNQQTNLNPGFTTGQGTLFTCANSNNVFYGGRSYTFIHNYVFATSVSSDTKVTFSAGVIENPSPAVGKTYSSVLDLNTVGLTGAVSGMAVQQSGSQYLYVAHSAQNIINVYQTSGNTGTFIRSISITNPTNLEFEGDNILWIAQGTTLTKYTVNTNGTITTTGNIISGFSRIAGLSILAGDICVLDGGNQQIVKRYNSTTLSATSIIGQLGGYSSSPAVANNKFYIEDLRGIYYTFVRHQSDGSIWVGDIGNCRYQHFDSAGNYLDNIMFLQQQYKCNVCINEPTSVFSDFLEYTIDYTQPLSSGWTLTNNWGANQPAGWEPVLPISSVILMSNGRKYAVMTKTNGSIYYYAELTTSGLRYITSTTLPISPSLDVSGNIYINNSTGTYPNQTTVYKKYALTGFDISHNPTYSGVTTYATVPLGNSGYATGGTYSQTTSGNIVIFNSQTATFGGGALKQFHLSGYNISSNQMLWRSCPEDFPAYTGNYPIDGTYDIGNAVWGAGSVNTTIGNNIFWVYRGEGWRGSETGIVEHFNDQGLMLGIFGVLGPQVINIQAPSGYAGNILSIASAVVGSNTYVYLNDEEHNSGLHRWLISNTSSISTQTISFTLSNRTLLIPPTKIDLLLGVPENGTVMGLSGWSQFPTSNFFTSQTNQFTTITRRAQIDLSKSPDVVVSAGGNVTGTTYYLNRQIPSAGPLTAWTLSGVLDLSRSAFTANANVSTTPWSNFMEIRDPSSKVIAQIIPMRTFQLVFNKATFGTYGPILYGTSPFVISRVGSNIHLSIFLFGQWLSTTQPIYDNSADISRPASIQWTFTFSNSQARQSQFGIVELFFDNN